MQVNFVKDVVQSVFVMSHLPSSWRLTENGVPESQCAQLFLGL